MPATWCPAGFALQGGVCVPPTSCPAGYTQQGNTCVPPTSCPAGYVLQGNVCVPPVQQQVAAAAPVINITNTNNNNNSNTGGNNTNTNNNTAPATPVWQAPVTYPIQYIYNTNTAPITPVWQAPVTYPIQYTFPQQTQVYNQNSYCAITASPSSVANGQAAYLSWSAPGATNAWLSDGIGAVQTNGTLAVRPNSSKTYTLTVSGQGGTNTCSTYVTVGGAPYVSLTQIPYTGLDLGPIGTMLYWLSILSLALAGAYLVTYYKGGAIALAQSTLGGRAHQHVTVAPMKAIESSFAKTVESFDSVVESVRAPFQNPPVVEDRAATSASSGTNDSMVVVHSKDGGVPRIVIARN